MLGASVHPAVHRLGGSINVVRTLKVAGRDQVMQIIDYLDNMEEEFHKFYPKNTYQIKDSYKASFEKSSWILRTKKYKNTISWWMILKI